MVITQRGEPARPLEVPSRAGVVEGEWSYQPVLVFVTEAGILDAAEATLGEGEATPSLALGNGLRLFVLSAKSTHLGCTVAFYAGLAAPLLFADYDGDGKLDGRLIDVCHQGQWDPYNRGEPFAGTPAPARLAVLDVRVEGGVLLATGFDGPVGPQD